MAINFPDSPAIDDKFSIDNKTWIWTGTVWELLGPVVIGPTGPTGPTGLTGNSGLNPIFSRQGTLSISTGTQRFYAERGGIINSVRASVGTPSQGSAIIVDVLKNGVTILDSPILIAAESFTSLGAITSNSVTAGDYFTVSVLQVGSVTAGANLTVTLSII